jgi:hypothetical protein
MSNVCQKAHAKIAWVRETGLMWEFHIPSIGTLGYLAGLVTAGRAVESISQYRYLGVSSNLEPIEAGEVGCDAHC